MNLGIDGKKALITAGSRGIGAAIAQALMDESVLVTVASRTEPQSYVDWIQCDLEDANVSEKLCRDTYDIVVHSFGGTGEVLDPLASAQDFSRVFRLNLGLSVEINRHHVRQMQRAGWGRVVYISSVAGTEHQGAVAYCAMKAAVNAYVRSLGRLVAKDGVVVASVCPGAVLTEGGYWDRAEDHHKSYFLRERQAIGRFGEPEEIASVVTFLCSERSSFVAGSNWLVDGGQGRSY